MRKYIWFKKDKCPPAKRGSGNKTSYDWYKIDNLQEINDINILRVV